MLRRAQLLPNKATPAYLSAMAHPGTNQFRDYEIGPSSVLNKLFHEAYIKLCLAAKPLMPCVALQLQHHINILDDGQVEVLFTAMVHRMAAPSPGGNGIGRAGKTYRAGSFPDSDVSHELEVNASGALAGSTAMQSPR